MFSPLMGPTRLHIRASRRESTSAIASAITSRSSEDSQGRPTLGEGRQAGEGMGWRGGVTATPSAILAPHERNAQPNGRKRMSIIFNVYPYFDLHLTRLTRPGPPTER